MFSPSWTELYRPTPKFHLRVRNPMSSAPLWQKLVGKMKKQISWQPEAETTQLGLDSQLAVSKSHCQVFPQRITSSVWSHHRFHQPLPPRGNRKTLIQKSPYINQLLLPMVKYDFLRFIPEKEAQKYAEDYGQNPFRSHPTSRVMKHFPMFGETLSSPDLSVSMTGCCQ